MITAETMINYGSYTISRYTYSADVSYQPRAKN